MQAAWRQMMNFTPRESDTEFHRVEVLGMQDRSIKQVADYATAVTFTRLQT